MSDYKVLIQGEWRPDDGFEVDLGLVEEGKPWWETPLPSCPSCGGTLGWAEAGNTPGTRACIGKPIGEQDGVPSYALENGCGSLYTIDFENGHLILRRERFYLPV